MSNQTNLIRIAYFTLNERYPMNHHRMNPENVSALEGYLNSVFPKDMISFTHIDSYYVDPKKFFTDKYDIIGINAHFRGILAVQEALNNWPLADMAPYIFIEGSFINSLLEGIRVIASLLKDRIPSAYIVYGEVEPAVQGLIEHVAGQRPLEHVPNLLIPSNSYEIREEPKLTDLSLITHQPYQYVKELLEYPIHTYHLQTSRGCCYANCAFCTDALIWGKVWRPFPIENVIHAFKDMRTEGIDYAFIFDKDFIGGKPDRAEQLANALIGMDNKIPYYGAFRATEIINAEKYLPLLKQSGLVFVFIGIETFSSAIAKRYQKGFTVKHSLKAIEILRSNQIDFRLGYIIDPLSTLEETLESIEVVRRYKLWGNIGNIFNQMSIRSGTKYEELGRQAEVIGDIDEENLTYHYEYADSRLGKTMEVCYEWFRTVPHINLYLLLGKRMTNVPGGNKTEYNLFNHYLSLLNKVDCYTLETVGRTILEGREKSLSNVTSQATVLYKELVKKLGEELNQKYLTSAAVLDEIKFNKYL